MNEKLREDLVKALGGMRLELGADDVGMILDAIEPVIDGVLWNAHHTLRGKCRHCNALVLERWAKLYHREVQPHRMSCIHYVGPLEHRDVYESQALTHWSTECSCGKSRDKSRELLCPNSAETWRGPKPK